MSRRDWIIGALVVVGYAWQWFTSELRIRRLVRAIESLRDNDA